MEHFTYLVSNISRNGEADKGLEVGIQDTMANLVIKPALQQHNAEYLQYQCKDCHALWF